MGSLWLPWKGLYLHVARALGGWWCGILCLKGSCRRFWMGSSSPSASSSSSFFTSFASVGDKRGSSRKSVCLDPCTLFLNRLLSPVFLLLRVGRGVEGLLFLVFPCLGGLAWCFVFRSAVSWAPWGVWLETSGSLGMDKPLVERAPGWATATVTARSLMRSSRRIIWACCSRRSPCRLRIPSRTSSWWALTESMWVMCSWSSSVRLERASLCSCTCRWEALLLSRRDLSRPVIRRSSLLVFFWSFLVQAFSKFRSVSVAVLKTFSSLDRPSYCLVSIWKRVSMLCDTLKLSAMFWRWLSVLSWNFLNFMVTRKKDDGQ